MYQLRFGPYIYIAVVFMSMDNGFDCLEGGAGEGKGKVKETEGKCGERKAPLTRKQDAKLKLSNTRGYKCYIYTSDEFYNINNYK